MREDGCGEVSCTSLCTCVSGHIEVGVREEVCEREGVHKRGFV